MNRVLRAADSGFLELRGRFKRAEDGSGPYPLFRFRRIYEGTFLFGGAIAAELEEVYYSKDRQPAYNYHLYYQATSAKDSAEKYDDLRAGFNHVLNGFEHTRAAGYDAWKRADTLQTAILLNSQDLPVSLQLQVHVAFPSPQW